MTILLDTNVVSELRKARSGRAHPSVTAWAARMPAGSLYLSAITLLELEMGVLQLERRDAAQGMILRTWLDRHVLPAFAGRVLAVDATALVHGMTVVTRNVADFEASGVPLLNPWLAQPAS